MRRRGASLLEILVAVGLTLIVGSLVSQLFIATLRSSERVDTQILLEQSAIFAFGRLGRDLNATSTAGFVWKRTVNPPLLAIAIQPLAPTLSEPRLAYSRQLVNYSWSGDSGKLLRTVLNETELGSILDTSIPQRRGSFNPITLPTTNTSQVLASNVVDFQVISAAPEPNFSNPLEVQIHLRKEIRGKRPADYQATQRFFIRTPSS